MDHDLPLEILAVNADLAGQWNMTELGFKIAFATCKMGCSSLVQLWLGYPARICASKLRLGIEQSLRVHWEREVTLTMSAPLRCLDRSTSILRGFDRQDYSSLDPLLDGRLWAPAEYWIPQI